MWEHGLQIKTVSLAWNGPTCSVLTVRVRVLLTFNSPPQPQQCVIDGRNCATGGAQNRLDTDAPSSNEVR